MENGGCETTESSFFSRFGTVFIMALDIVFPALSYVEKANNHVKFEQIDSKCYINNVRLAVSKEADL